MKKEEEQEQAIQMGRWIKRLARWIEVSDVPAIPFAGFSRVGTRNPPSPSIQILYRSKYDSDSLYIGDRLVEAPKNHASIRNVHFGGHTLDCRKDLETWSLFLDVSDTIEFPELAKAPLHYSIPVVNPAPLISLFEQIGTLCIDPHRRQVSGYHLGSYAYAPERDIQTTLAKKLRIKAAILELFANLIEESEALRTEQPSHDPPVQSALEFMGRSYTNDALSIQDVADAVELNVVYFGRIFHQQVGTTPVKYLRRIRMERARLLLKQTQLYIAEIATDVGFSDPLYFSRIFKKEEGISPREYRKRY